MKLSKILLAGGVVVLSALSMTAAPEERVLGIYDKAVFYDGYNANVFDKDAADGILRHTNYLYAKRLTDADLQWFGNDLTMKVTIGALCDNYDRLGNVTLALVPKGEESYDINEVQRIEVARFVTPFMNKNRQPNSVPYEYKLPGLSLIMRDAALRAKYDFWLEFEVFGIPYAANQQIVGCATRNDVFSGTLEFVSADEPAALTDDNVLVPIVMKKTEIHGPKNFNSYTEGACDELGKAAKTYRFTLDEDVNDARIILITSNHGAAENGEEYVRRHHFVYVDGEPVFDYTPGGVDCEPYRKYNTQANGIYGYTPDYDFWYNYSNWCPGQAFPIREIHLGAMKAGEHSMLLSVPDAEFYGNQGDFYVSAYLQGARKGLVPSEVPELVMKADFEFRQEGNALFFHGAESAAEVAIYSIGGELLYGRHNPGDSISLETFAPGLYLVSVRTADGRAALHKMVVK